VEAAVVDGVFQEMRLLSALEAELTVLIPHDIGGA
jgi:hypothetical protein